MSKTGAPETVDIRLLDAMPRPLLVVFVSLALVAIGAAVFVLVRPPTFDPVSVAERRPPPSEAFTHDAIKVVAAPTPSVIPTLPAPCEAVDGARLIGGGDAVLRLRGALEQACRLESGVSADVTAAVRALDRATIRFAGFQRTGVESTLEISTRTIWLNVKFARTKLAIANIVPVLLHDAWHLAHLADGVDATQELGARRVEVAACRHVLDVRSWPRWCEDARALTDLAPGAATALLRGAGYR